MGGCFSIYAAAAATTAGAQQQAELQSVIRQVRSLFCCALNVTSGVNACSALTVCVESNQSVELLLQLDSIGPWP